MRPSIQIVTDRPDSILDNYLIAKLAWNWKRAGFRITTGPVSEIASDVNLAILHIDRTKICSTQVPVNPARKPFLNSHVLDISKHLFSKLRVLPKDPWEGAVIIKSDLNCFGAPEWKSQPHGFLEGKRRKFARKFWRLARMLPPGQYPVLPNLSAVPGWVWEHPELIVERFIPERDHHRYCIRSWVFFGKQSYTFRLFSKEKVVKMSSITSHEFLEEPPAELEASRKTYGLDFGKFDYVEVDGTPILLDINKTPTSSAEPDTPRLRRLADGLAEMMEEPL